MRILHVVLGDPHTHQGGLCRYCLELAEEQSAMGNSVTILYPGPYFSGKYPRIRRQRKNEYRVVDALPVPITYGIGEPERYMVSPHTNCYFKWLKRKQFDVIHVHSIQGIHKELLSSARELGIPVLFTTHDYFSFCHRCVLVDRTGNLCAEHSVEKCARCNANAGLSANKQRIIQSRIYQMLKTSNLIRRLKRRVGASGIEEDKNCEVNVSEVMTHKYEQLQSYYKEMTGCVSLFHCNSTITAEKYEKSFPRVPRVVTSITHRGLTRSCHERKEQTLRISYMGGMSKHKGYNVLTESLEQLDKLGYRDWQIYLYGGEYSQRKEDYRYVYGGFFTKEEESDIWENTDVLVVASQCWETFGFVVLEALCHGIPVLCSDLVGSKDLVSQVYPDLIFGHENSSELAEKLALLANMKFYESITERIRKAELHFSMEEHAKTITEIYRSMRKTE